MLILLELIILIICPTTSILNKVLEFLNGEDPTVKEAEDGSRGVLLADLGGCIQVSALLFIFSLPTLILSILTIGSGT